MGYFKRRGGGEERGVSLDGRAGGWCGGFRGWLVMPPTDEDLRLKGVEKKSRRTLARVPP